MAKNPVATALIDVNGDGADDLVTLHRGYTTGIFNPVTTPGRISVRLNTCAGDYFDGPGSDEYDPAFVNQINMDIGELASPADRPDIACISAGSGSQPHRLTILQNDGAGGFTIIEEIDLATGGDGPKDIDIEDLDSDGDGDILICGRLTQSTQVWVVWNNAGAWDVEAEEPADCSTNSASDLTCILGCDLDQQNGSDIVVGTENADCELQVFLNNGPSGGQAARFDLTVPADFIYSFDGIFTVPPLDVVSGRFNDDPGITEYPDLAVTLDRGEPHEIVVFLNRWPATGGDEILGDPDVFAYEFDPFSSTNHRIRALAAGDLDGDGFDEIVGAKRLPDADLEGGGLSVLLNLTIPESSFGGFLRWLPQGNLYDEDYIIHRNALDVALGDANADGCTDAVTVEPPPLTGGGGRPGLASIFFGDCFGNLRVQDRYRHLHRFSADVKHGHFGGDVDAQDADLFDLAIATQTRNTLMIWRQSAAHTFSLAQEIPPGSPEDPGFGGKPWSLVVGDLDGANEDDVAICVSAGTSPDSGVYVFLSQSNGLLDTTGQFVSLHNTGGTDPVGIDAADLNTDGSPELVVCDLAVNGSAVVHVLVNNGSGTFANSGAPIIMGGTGAQDPVDIIAVDLDQNGIPDIVTANHPTNNISVGMNPTQTMSGNFTASVTIYAVGQEPQAVAFGNLNSGDEPDIVVADSLSDAVSVLLNTGNGTLEDEVRYDVGIKPAAIAARDVDQDGFDEIITRDAIDDTLSALMSDPQGTGAFDDTKRVILSADGLEVEREPTGLDSCDLDNNGTFDLVHLCNHATDPHPDTNFRITWNRCICEEIPGCNDYCTLKGDLNDDGLVDGDDIQGFVETYFDPPTASADDFCAADTIADCGLNAPDHKCFVRKLLKLPCGDGACGEEGGEALMGESQSSAPEETESSQETETSHETDPTLQAQIDAVLFWLEENPHSEYPELSDAEYVEAVIGVMVEVGLVEAE